MSKQLVQFDAGDGSQILVEIEEPDNVEGYRLATGGQILVTRAATTLSETFQSLSPIVKCITDSFKRLPQRPDSIKLEFGLKFGVKGELVIASGQGEGTCKIELSWNTD